LLYFLLQVSVGEVAAPVPMLLESERGDKMGSGRWGTEVGGAVTFSSVVEGEMRLKEACLWERKSKLGTAKSANVYFCFPPTSSAVMG
jgi:hypothetical protein